MRVPNALLLLLISINGHEVLAAPTFGLFSDALGYFMGAKNGKPPTGAAGNSPPAKQDIANAARLWQGDTETVSNFLSRAETLSPQELKDQGTLALAAVKDELVQKAVLDKVFLNGTAEVRDPRVVEADDRLANQGTFAFVVDGIALFSKRGAELTPDEVATLVKAVNQDRCPNVLPSVDAYLSAAEISFGSGNGTLKAIRPTNC
ncbi:hypothetical protein IF2G_07315 [Cordyceps javanica]|nr:hypothetical protein IF2G_07315 [Cordyceps javanica]